MSTAPPPPPPPYVRAAVPPPPPGRRRRATAIAVGALVAMAAFAAGVVVGRQGGDDESAERSVDTTARAPATTAARPARTTTTGGVEPTAAPDTTTPPAPGPPLPFTTLDEAVHPADVAALRALLDQLGFPDWWPLPDAIAPESAPFPTVQAIRAKDGVLNPGRTDASGSSDVSTEWLVDTADVTAAEALWVPKISADRFDIDAGLAEKDTTIENGVTEVTYSFPVLDDDSFDALYVSIRDAIDTNTATRVGTVVRFGWSVYDYDRPAPVPIGTAPGKAFLGLAPASPEMVWNSTEVAVTGGLNPYGTFEPDITLKATWHVQGADVDAVIAFLSDPVNFAGDLELVSAGVFTTDELWVQPMGYQGLIGEYSLLTPEPGDNTYLHLEFTLK